MLKKHATFLLDANPINAKNLQCIVHVVNNGGKMVQNRSESDIGLVL
ncbi:hypothetical protein [Legionella brunensis]|nr:hypothetical protein [Legionella brunensis]